MIESKLIKKQTTVSLCKFIAIFITPKVGCDTLNKNSVKTAGYCTEIITSLGSKTWDCYLLLGLNINSLSVFKLKISFVEKYWYYGTVRLLLVGGVWKEERRRGRRGEFGKFSEMD